MIAITFWQALLVVLLIVVFFIVNTTAFIAWLEDWWEESGWHFLGAVLISLTAIAMWAGLIMIISNSDDDVGDRAACEQAGGYWQQTGTRPLMVGKVMTVQPVFGCVMREG